MLRLTIEFKYRDIYSLILFSQDRSTVPYLCMEYHIRKHDVISLGLWSEAIVGPEDLNPLWNTRSPRMELPREYCSPDRVFTCNPKRFIRTHVPRTIKKYIFLQTKLSQTGLYHTLVTEY